MDIRQKAQQAEKLLAAQEDAIIAMDLSEEGFPPRDACITDTHAVLSALEEVFQDAERLRRFPVAAINLLRKPLNTAVSNLEQFAKEQDKAQRNNFAETALRHLDNLNASALQRSVMSFGMTRKQLDSRISKFDAVANGFATEAEAAVEDVTG